VLAGESALNEELAMRLLMSMINRDGQEEGGSAGSSTFERPLGERGQSRLDDTLTPREVEVLRLVVQGWTNQQIARNLSISMSTVKRHIRHIITKLGVCDRVQAAVRAVELGVLDERNGV
jgi:DNA-binding NarL/FixJ family response regulator